MKKFNEIMITVTVLAFLLSASLLAISLIGFTISVGIWALTVNFWLGMIVFTGLATLLIYLIAQVIPEED